MKNVTITMDEDTARWVRLQAAERDTSVSRFVGEVLRERMKLEQAQYTAAMRRYLARSPVRLSDGAYPTREELHDRHSLR